MTKDDAERHELITEVGRELEELREAADRLDEVAAAQFNLNLLARINRELGGHFDLHLFRHLALWNPEHHRIEMHLESTRNQTVAIDGLGIEVAFKAGERIHTENSYKYRQAEVSDILCRAGFRLEHTWTDRRRWFGLHLARVQ